MKVLHLFSNAKWTGPAEPALNLCVTLRRLGVDAEFACCPDAGASINKVVETARDRGIEPILRFYLYKHLNPVTNYLDRMALKRYLATTHYDLIHCHLDNAHRIAMGPACALGIPLIRSSYSGTGFPDTREFRKLTLGTARILEPSHAAREHDLHTFGLAPERTVVVPGAVDVERFDPVRDTPDGRRWLGIPANAFVVGIVARMQTHRHYEDFFRAVRLLVDRCPNAHVVVVGRGTKQESVGKQPVRDLGLEQHVHFPGYLDGENYVGMLRSFDAKVFLVPGTDGTCRAVREAMAMAKPTVVADRGMLREIVDDGVNGFVCDGSPEGLFGALRRLADNRALARQLGRAAREKAVNTFSLDTQARAVLREYTACLTVRP